MYAITLWTISSMLSPDSEVLLLFRTFLIKPASSVLKEEVGRNESRMSKLSTAEKYYVQKSIMCQYQPSSQEKQIYTNKRNR